MSERDDIKIAANMTFRAADKFFKFTSWLAFLAAVKYVHKTTQNPSIAWLDDIATGLFTATLFLQALHLFARSPSDWDVPDAMAPVVKTGQIIAALLLGLMMSSPYMFLDQIIDSLTQVKTK